MVSSERAARASVECAKVWLSCLVFAVGLGCGSHGDEPVVETAPICTTDRECGDGVCVAVGGHGKVCAERCDDGRPCAAGYQCALTDAAALCVLDSVANCQPCQVESDCNQAGLTGYACIAYGPQGSFCGSPCDVSRGCGKGYDCVTGRCRLSSGTCACNDIGVALGAETSCEVVNAFGTCVGMRGCGASGLSPCIGATPSAEICDARDNDCDGATDEDLDCARAGDGIGRVTPRSEHPLRSERQLSGPAAGSARLAR